jgi:lysine-arginine-ornithine-binding protein
MNCRIFRLAMAIKPGQKMAMTIASLTRRGLAALFLASLAASAQAAPRQLIIATEGAYPPYNFVASDGTLQGFDVDFAKALCVKLQAECQIIQQNWDGMIPALLARKYDLMVASMAILPEREKQIAFSIPYYQGPTALIMARADAVRTGADGYAEPQAMAGKRVGVQIGTVYEKFVRREWPGAEVLTYDTADNADSDLRAGRIDARLDDYIVLRQSLLGADQNGAFARVGKIWGGAPFGSRGQGVGLRPEDAALKAEVDRAILSMRDDGTYKAINDKYFDFDIYQP